MGANAEATEMRRLEIGSIPTIDAAGGAPRGPPIQQRSNVYEKGTLLL